jgi:hypothetical protein
MLGQNWQHIFVFYLILYYVFVFSLIAHHKAGFGYSGVITTDSPWKVSLEFWHKHCFLHKSRVEAPTPTGGASMELEARPFGSMKNGLLNHERPRCTRCGHVLRFSHEWIKDGEDVFCGFCYRSLLSSHLKVNSMEMQD